MISKNEIKYIQSLYHKKTRDKENVFIVEGQKMVTELFQSNFGIKKVYATEKYVVPEWYSSAVTMISDIELGKMSRLETPNQVLAVVEKKQQQQRIDTEQIILALDGIQDPGNLGTIIRIADWFGIQQIVASQDSADCYNPKTVQATMGSIFRVDVQYLDLNNFLSQSKTKILGALLNGNNVLQHSSISKGILVIGNESKGIRENIKPYINEAVSIPAFGKAESLNAAVATGIILSHLIKK
ncbi:hypothetical protein A9P82_02320 [Arachidicoccus ginsenosidimutans]|uniref:TrmH family RNA methyltransferase n=1 Tax=Arachidicoccus sp. BS20 TaxID=1850526 RepID=UPI0007F167D9|nr:RNA methyltransferase [Arachidicoccus sp. BS20]ANI88239.1 hypothetical protein A9P82_02320 [Arachidicoccus sp. BS20]